MTVWLKQGVWGTLSPVMRKAKGKLADLFASKYLDLQITSIREGTHRVDSLHYEGDAIDIRPQGVTKEEIKRSLTALEIQYGGRFDVVVHSTHIHIEYDLL